MSKEQRIIIRKRIIYLLNKPVTPFNIEKLFTKYLIIGNLNWIGVGKKFKRQEHVCR